MTDNEHRVTSKTGGQKGAKDVAMGLIPIGPLSDVARLYNFGAKKYSPNNWRKGYDWHLSYDALQRHATQFWNGEDLDEESGLPHLASVVFHALALMEFMHSYREGDDRPPPSGTLFVEEPERKQESTPVEGVDGMYPLSAVGCGYCSVMLRLGREVGVKGWWHGQHCALYMANTTGKCDG